MRSKRATISNDTEISEPNSSCATRILQERNRNIFDDIFGRGNKTATTKKSLSLKFQQAQRDHCCIDIVHRKNFSEVKQQQKITRIELLKREINYLERNDLKWDMFPKENQQGQKMFQTLSTKISANKDDFQICSINSIKQEEKKMKKSFKNIFQGKIDNSRPITSDQRLKYKNLFQSRKISVKNCNNYLKQNISQRSKIIHGKATISTPFRRYFKNNQTKKNNSSKIYMDQIQGKRVCLKNIFIAQNLED